MLRYIFIILIAVSLASCFPGAIHKSYIPNPPAVNHFKEKGDHNLNIKGNFSTVEVQGNKAVGNRWGISSNVLLRTNMGAGINVGPVWYKKNKKNYIEIASNFGYTHFNSSIDRILPLIVIGGTDYFHHVICKYYNFSLQPSLLYILGDGNSFGFSLHINTLYFTKYHFHLKEEWSWEGYYDMLPLEYEKVDLNNFYALLIEPTVTFKTNKDSKLNYMFQAGYSFNTNPIQSKLTLKGDMYQNYNTETYTNYHPNYRHIIFNFGIYITLGKQ